MRAYGALGGWVSGVTDFLVAGQKIRDAWPERLFDTIFGESVWGVAWPPMLAARRASVKDSADLARAHRPAEWSRVRGIGLATAQAGLVRSSRGIHDGARP